jgi:hypothetical protein
VTTSNKASFTSKVMFHVENEMSSDAFEAWRCRSVQTDVLKCVVARDLVHFTADRNVPKVVTVHGIKTDGIIPSFGKLAGRQTCSVNRLTRNSTWLDASFWQTS